MGSAPSMTPERMVELFSSHSDVLFASDHWDGFQVDSSLQRFSGLNSTQELVRYRDQVLYSDGFQQAGSVVEKLGPALGGLTVVPNAVGLGALVISIILEAVGKSLLKKTLGTKEMIKRVFAQEKAREVRDMMENYLDQLEINLGDKQRLLAVTRLKEPQLSTQLTRLKNSMLQDGHMTTRALRQWVNGAAFHTQMLIHEARLEGASGSRATRAARIYQQQLDRLLEAYKKHLETVVEVYEHRSPWYTISCCVTYKESPSPSSQSPCVGSLFQSGGCTTGKVVVEVYHDQESVP